MKIIFSILCGLLLTSCPNKNMNDNQETKEIVHLFEGNLLGAGEEGLKKENFIISSEKEWKEFLNKINRINKVSSKFEPSVNFSTDMVLIAIEEVKTTGGFGIKVAELEEEKEKINVIVERIGPKPTDMVIMVITQPINIVKIKKTNKEIIFVEKSK
ncbi:conserved hypothetical protein [Tenacibaculum sediminilitoris]|uniref:protease complex subunit PrcB family protein n=1 Tax=Tenacibaculum sediminilitoris TaxID=1820334 RepID=UPI003892D67E